MSKNKQMLLIYLFLTIATLMAFWQVMSCDFTNYDDPEYVIKNSHIQNGITFEGIRWAFTTGYASNWHPLTWMSHMLDVQFFGVTPRWHHLTNLLFHLANALLLFYVLHRMTKSLWQSAFVAALFALHPLHVESVAWVAERKDVLSAFFWMLTMTAYVSYVERPGLRRYLVVVFVYLSGLMAKPMLVTLPFVLLLLDYWPLQRFQRKRSDQGIQTGAQWSLMRPLLWEKIPFIGMAILSSIITYIAQHKGGSVASIETYSLSVRLSNACVSYVTYIRKMIWPTDLAVLYPHPGTRPAWQIWGALLLLIAATILIIRSTKKYQYLAVGWFWYLGTLVPVIGIVQVGSQARADRYTYIPLIGVFIMTAWGIPQLVNMWRLGKEALFVSAALILSCLSIITWIQVGHWQNSITLYNHTLNVTEHNMLAHYNRGQAYYSIGSYRQAIEDNDEAIKIDPRYAEAYNNRGSAYADLGNAMRAIEDYNKAIEYKPHFADAYYNRGNSYMSLGKQRQAIEDYDRFIEIDPRDAGVYLNRGAAYGILGDYGHAIQDFSKAIEIKPKYADAYGNRGNAYAVLGNNKEAIEDLKRAAALGHEASQKSLTSRGINW